MNKTKTKKKDYQYLDEDRDIIEELGLSVQGIRDRESSLKESFKVDLSALQIKSTLRNRKTMVDLDKSNKRFSMVILFFAFIQFAIAGFQLVMQFVDSPSRAFAMFFSGVFLVFMFWIVRNVGNLNK